ncbi:MAG: heavy metal translocating P-type ATPase [Sulfurimonas sp.]|nr:heavy metal translocating P-type ATPase [Sulfurimonas sp.]
MKNETVFGSLELLHSTSQRMRIRYTCRHKCNMQEISVYISLYDWVRDVRVNRETQSLILHYKNLSSDAVIEKLKNISVGDVESRTLEGESSKLFPLTMPLAVLGSVLVLPQSLKFPITFLATYKNILKGGKYLLKGGITSEVLESLAIIISLQRKDYFAAATTNFLLEFAEYIEENIEKKSDAMLQSLLVPDIKEVWVENEGVDLLIPFEDVKVGDIVIINAGDTVPVDGTIISGEASVDESSMSGEAIPVKRSRGDYAISGTILLEGRIKIWAEQVGEQSASYKIASMIKSSLESKSNTQIEASKLADKLVPVTLGLAGISYLFTRDLERVAAVFQADYSCALKLATPVAFKSGMYQAANEGALIKGADILEKISQADTIIFDKTGTLSTGKLNVKEVFSLDDSWSKEDILSLTASIEEHYFHPIAEAVVNAAKSCDMYKHFHHTEVEFIVAHGVCAFVDGKKVLIGSRHFLEDDEQIPFLISESIIENEYEKGSTLLYITYDGKLLGMISLYDETRQNAAQTIERLKNLGINNIVMLTGDHIQKANSMAKELGIKNFHAQLTPQDKLEIVKKLAQDGSKIIFVGDGINDAPSLAQSNVGIAMQRGADIARVSADVVLLEDDIGVIADIKELADKTLKRVQSNYNATIAINSAILLLATFGKLSPVAASVLHNGTTIAVLANAMRKF